LPTPPTVALLPLPEMEEPSSLGEQVVELASPFSTAGGRQVTAAAVLTEQVDMVLVVETLAGGRTVVATAVLPVDLRVGVTVAEGLVKAVGLLSLSTSGLMGTVAEVAGVPTLLGSGRVAGTVVVAAACLLCGSRNSSPGGRAAAPSGGGNGWLFSAATRLLGGI
jgi:hypothetical protein